MPTDFEAQRDAILRGRMGSRDIPVDPIEFVMHALKYDPEQDGLYLCGKCGLTWDHECGYGGWHVVTQMLDVRFHQAENATPDSSAQVTRSGSNGAPE